MTTRPVISDAAYHQLLLTDAMSFAGWTAMETEAILVAVAAVAPEYLWSILSIARTIPVCEEITGRVIRTEQDVRWMLDDAVKHGGIACYWHAADLR